MDDVLPEAPDAAGASGASPRPFIPLPLPEVGDRPLRAARVGPRRRLAQTLDAVAAWVPMALMALVALGTWWLVKNTPLIEPGRPAVAPRHEPDATMSRFSVQRFAADGTLRVEIDGERMRHYPDTDTYDIDDARMRSIGADGRVALASATRALANRDASEVRLNGGAHVIREATAGEAAIDFRGEFLDVLQTTEQLRSHLPVVITQGGNEIHAEGMTYDHLTRIVQLRGRVRAVLTPPARQGARETARSTGPRGAETLTPLATVKR